MGKTLQDIARELLNSEHNNGFGIRCFAVTQACEKYGVDAKELIAEIITQGNQDDDEE
jgi:hypothetical protein